MTRSGWIARALCAALGLSAALMGCGPVKVPLGANQTLSDDYEKVLKAFTRHEETYEHFESRVFVDATYFAPVFARAYVKQRTQRLGLTPDESKAEYSRLVDPTATEARFFLFVVTNDFFWNDLDNKKGTMRSRLIVNGEAVQPISITRLTDDALSDLIPFFPYVTLLGRGYWAVFPKPSGKAVQLRISGAPAIIDLQWSGK